MHRRHARRLAVPLILAALVTAAGAGPGWLSTSQPAAAAYAYWSYWHGDDGEWTYSRVGPASYTADAGDVEGWSFNPAGSGGPNDEPPSAKPDAGVCKNEPKNKVAVYIDSGSATPRALCAAPGRGLPVLRSVATVVVADDGLVCRIDETPKSGCGEVVDPTPRPTSAPPTTTPPTTTPPTTPPTTRPTTPPTKPPTTRPTPRPSTTPKPEPSSTRTATQAPPAASPSASRSPAAQRSATPEPKETSPPPPTSPAPTSDAAPTATPEPTLTGMTAPLPDSSLVPDVAELLARGGDFLPPQPLVATTTGPDSTPTPTPTLLIGPQARPAASDDAAGSTVVAGLGVLTIAGLAGAGIRTARRRQRDA